MKLVPFCIVPAAPPSTFECPHCGYDLHGIPASGSAILCPECGRKSHPLSLPRSRWWRYPLALITGSAVTAITSAIGAFITYRSSVPVPILLTLAFVLPFLLGAAVVMLMIRRDRLAYINWEAKIMGGTPKPLPALIVDYFVAMLGIGLVLFLGVMAVLGLVRVLEILALW